MLIAKNIFLKKGASQILQDITLEFRVGCSTLLLGKSGAGKSSFLRCLAQLETGYTGTVSFGDIVLKPLSPLQRSQIIGFIPQRYALFPHLSVLENCIQPLRVVYQKSKKNAYESAIQILQMLE